MRRWGVLHETRREAAIDGDRDAPLGDQRDHRFEAGALRAELAPRPPREPIAEHEPHRRATGDSRGKRSAKREQC
jgi:hypothetical protein